MSGSDGWGAAGKAFYVPSLLVLSSCRSRPSGVACAIFCSVGVTFCSAGTLVHVHT